MLSVTLMPKIRKRPVNPSGGHRSSQANPRTLRHQGLRALLRKTGRFEDFEVEA
jgi:hypothetical protein